ncbi:hypothetical protein [Caballeronia sp. LZ035]|uniref:hypothetical protein n=1 Tax=Caballeronia sp. LZ035 TaxID=3038568 RepID=UPI0028542481|nr:hypothetical protein [Caballeronia sp. LZ035]MDR5761966.1 hypothetical protein [Caballeronia sp. LZ035]
MAYGLECYDAAGNAVLKVTDRITRFAGQIDTGTASGSISVPVFSNGEPWFNVRDIDPFSQSTVPPSVSRSGTTISWTFPTTSYPNRSVRVLYGVY